MLCRTLFVPLCAITALVRPVLAQHSAPQARSFFFDNYTSVMRFDLKAMRDTGVWDEISASGLKVVRGMIKDQFGFTFEQLDRVTSLRAPKVVAGQVVGCLEIVAIEGNDDLGQTMDMRAGRCQEEQAGSYTMLLDRWTDDAAVVQVTPKLRVYGPPTMLEPVLTGKPRAGLPSGDVMSLTAAQQDVLVYFVFDLRYDDDPRGMLHEALPDTGWPADDEPTFACGRIRATGDEDDPHLTLELILRHGTDGEGLVTTEAAVGVALEKLSKLQQARLFRPLLKKVEHERDGTDAVWRVDLGRARQAFGSFNLLLPMMFMTGSEVPAQALGGEIRVIAEAPVVAEPVVPKPGKKKEKKKSPDRLQQ